MKKYIVSILLCSIAWSVSASDRTSTCRCDKGLVSLGDRQTEILRKCDEPTYKYERKREEKIIMEYQKRGQLTGKKNDRKHEVTQDPHIHLDEKVKVLYEHLDTRYRVKKRERQAYLLEEWTYNLGINRFIQTFIFENQRLIFIEIGGYGVSKNTPIAASKWGKGRVAIGASTAEILMKCGEPTSKKQRTEEEIFIKCLAEAPLRLEEARIFTDIEEWTYNFGPNQFMRILIFENNRLVSTKTGGYGY